MLKKTGKRIKDLPLNKIAPNMVTMMALCSGVTSIRYATEGRFQLAVFFILMAAVFDALDGRVALFCLALLGRLVVHAHGVDVVGIRLLRKLLGKQEVSGVAVGYLDHLAALAFAADVLR